MTYTMEQARFDIAAAHRLGVKFNINEGFNGGHFTLMAPGYTNRILTIPNGLHWEEVLPEKVILIDLEANTLEGQGQVERSAFNIHSGLHRRRPDLRCFLHAHMPYFYQAEGKKEQPKQRKTKGAKRSQGENAEHNQAQPSTT